MARRFRSSWAATFALAIATAAPHARAQDAQASAAAEALFEQARKLMDGGKYGEACPKFAESNRLDPGIGTLLYLADCYDKNGQSASAWASFREAADAAKAAGQADREQKARARAAALEPKLAKLTIVAPADIAGLEVQRDGLPVGQPLWGTPVPVDPGKHVLSARAPGKKPWSDNVVVPKDPGAAVTSTIPALQDAPPEPSGAVTKPGGDTGPSAPGTQGEDDTGKTRRIVGLAVGGAGVVGVGIGVVFGLIAKSKNDEALEPQNCPNERQCYASGTALTKDAQGAATVSTIAFIAGGVLVAGGAVLFFTAPSSPRKTAGTGLRVAPVVAPGTAGVWAGARF